MYLRLCGIIIRLWHTVELSRVVNIGAFAGARRKLYDVEAGHDEQSKERAAASPIGSEYQQTLWGKVPRGGELQGPR